MAGLSVLGTHDLGRSRCGEDLLCSSSCPRGEAAHSNQLGHDAHFYGARIAPRRPLRRALACPCLLDARIDPHRPLYHVLVLVLSVVVRAQVRRTLPLYAGVILLPRGAASGGKRRSIGAAESMASPQAALEPRSGTTVRPLARAFYWPRGLAAC